GGRRDRPRGGSGIGAPARLWPACRGESRYSSVDGTASTERARMSPPAQQTRRQRRRMVARQLVDRGIRQRRLLAAMAWVPREWFVPPHLAGDAYDDAPLPIGSGQTISQPYIVALMPERLAPVRVGKALGLGPVTGFQ